jgi:SulP family sulfate permease
VNELAARVFGSWVHRVGRASLRADLVAGVLGALLVLPQGIAFATLAGLPPEYGLYTAIVPCIVAQFGSSWHVVSGPTNANSLALFATLAPLALVGSPDYIALALAVTVIVGTMQFLIGALRLGTIANFISPAALRGFTGGAAALIALYALPDLLGLRPPSAHRPAPRPAPVGERRSRADALPSAPSSVAHRALKLVAARAVHAARPARCDRVAFAIDRVSAARNGSRSSGRSRRSGRASVSRCSTCACFPT